MVIGYRGTFALISACRLARSVDGSAMANHAMKGEGPKFGGKMFKKFLVAAALLASVFLGQTANATNQLATAIGGHDSVSYFREGKPVQGQAKFHHFWNGAVWYFSSAENRDIFAGDPKAFAPQYDGYCAWAASQNYKRPGDPNVWQIVDNKLYLKVHAGAQKKWRADIAKHIDRGDQNWIKIAPY
jgi:YHS domain-containing protein